MVPHAKIYNDNSGIGGRDYLAHVLQYGLTGLISVEGAAYNGNMPAWGGSLTDQQITDVLNYVVTAFGNRDSLPSDFQPYTVDEVNAVSGKDLSGNDAFLLEQASTSAGPFEQAVQTQSNARIMNALQALPDSFRQVILLRDIEGFNYQQVGQILDIAQGTVMSRLSRGRRLLASLLIRTESGRFSELHLELQDWLAGYVDGELDDVPITLIPPELHKRLDDALANTADISVPAQLAGGRLLATWNTSVGGAPAQAFAIRLGNSLVVQYRISEHVLFQNPDVRQAMATMGGYRIRENQLEVLAMPMKEAGLLVVGLANAMPATNELNLKST